MSAKTPFLVWFIALVVLGLTWYAIVTPLKFTQAQGSERSQDITVTMYALNANGGQVEENPSCMLDDPNTLDVDETDKRYGCTAFDEVNHPEDIRPCTLTNPVAVSIENEL